MIRKRMLAAGLCLMLLSLCLSATGTTLFPYQTVTTANVNLRRSASSTAVILEELAEGTSVSVLGESGSYLKVSTGNHTGYVLRDYLKPGGGMVVESATNLADTATGYPYETTSREKVNLRARKSTESTLVDQVPKGATVTVNAVTGDWAKIDFNGHSGYVLAEYLNIKTIVEATRAGVDPIPTLSAEDEASYYMVLQEDDTGEHVTALQRALIELGYLRSGADDGVFGGTTRKAVIAFQEKNGYPTTGVVDANLQAFLYSGKPLNSKGNKTSVTTLSAVPGATMRAGSTGEAVGRLQIRLVELGYYTGSITMKYDTATQKAVKNFQKKNGLSATAYCDKTTQELIFADTALAVDATPTPLPTATPTAVPTLMRPNGTVRSGASGEDARRVQQRLKDLGYLTGKVDGVFGSASVEALKAFQTKHHLTADGVCGDETVALLFSYDALTVRDTPAPVITPTPVPSPTPTPEPLTPENAISIKLNTAGDVVLRLQQRLTELGYYSAVLDGVCKADDVAAIKTFQEFNGLKVDGIAGYETQVKLYAKTAIAYTSEAVQDLKQDGYTTLKKGMTGSDVTKLQNRLIELKYLYGRADGVYGTTTAEAIATFQKQNGLTMDGVAGEKTLTRLYSTSAIAKPAATATPKPTATATPVPETVLKRGDTSSAVKAMQERLIALGYLSGKADGNFGTQTYQALLAFQRKNGLSADGIAGSKTLEVLSSSRAVAGTSTITQTVVNATVGRNASTPRASSVKYANWYTTVKAVCRKYPYVTIYDFASGLSWQVHIFSLGAHADAEPVTATDTAHMLESFGGVNTWTPKPVWVIFSNGDVYMASTHDMPHEVQHITDNNFEGHLCIHFPRTDAQVAAIGSYATSHQSAIDRGWAETRLLR